MWMCVSQFAMENNCTHIIFAYQQPKPPDPWVPCWGACAYCANGWQECWLQSTCPQQWSKCLPYIHNSIYFLQFLIPHCEKALPSPHKQIQTIAPTRCYKQDLLHEHGSNNQRHYGTLSYGDNHLRVFLLEVVPCFLAKVFCLFEAKGCQLTLHCSNSLTHGFLPSCFILSPPMELSWDDDFLFFLPLSALCTKALVTRLVSSGLL